MRTPIARRIVGNMNSQLRALRRLLAAAVLLLVTGALHAQTTDPPVLENCQRQIWADVVALDHFFWNRLGAVQPQGMMYALRRDIVEIEPGKGYVAGNVRLRDDKRPRPLVRRMNVGDCLRIEFQNLLSKEIQERNDPSTVVLSRAPASTPPVMNSNRSPARCSRSRHSSYARRSNGTYRGSFAYASRMIRLTPCDDPSSCGMSNRSSPSTFSPRRARW
jgi:hypothetical protein